MAIIVNQNGFAGFGATPDSGAAILNTYTISQQVQSKPITYRFYAGWVKTDSRFADINYFENFLLNEAQKMNAAIIIRVI